MCVRQARRRRSAGAGPRVSIRPGVKAAYRAVSASPLTTPRARRCWRHGLNPDRGPSSRHRRMSPRVMRRCSRRVLRTTRTRPRLSATQRRSIRLVRRSLHPMSPRSQSRTSSIGSPAPKRLRLALATWSQDWRDPHPGPAAVETIARRYLLAPASMTGTNTPVADCRASVRPSYGMWRELRAGISCRCGGLERCRSDTKCGPGGDRGSGRVGGENARHEVLSCCASLGRRRFWRARSASLGSGHESRKSGPNPGVQTGGTS